MAVIKGNTYSETITGTSGNDTIDGNGGSDSIDGGGGIDTAVFFANSSDFTVTNLSGVVRVTALSSAPYSPSPYTYSTVNLKNVEKLQFLDKTIELSDSGVEGSTSYSISPATISISENTSSQSFTITRSGDLTAETIYVSTTSTTEGYSNSSDYKGILNQAVSFGAGVTSAEVKVEIINDATPEEDETFGLIVQRNADDSASTFLAKSTFTISDDDSGDTTPGLKTTPDNILVAAVNLSARAYSDTHYNDPLVISEINTRVESWTPLKAVDLGFSETDSRFEAGRDLLRYDFDNASATAGLTILDGKRTLGIAFEGTNGLLTEDMSENIKNIDEYYHSLSDFTKAIFEYLMKDTNGIEQVLVTGHSLGGATAQNFT